VHSPVPPLTPASLSVAPWGIGGGSMCLMTHFVKVEREVVVSQFETHSPCAKAGSQHTASKLVAHQNDAAIRYLGAFSPCLGHSHTDAVHDDSGFDSGRTQASLKAQLRLGLSKPRHYQRSHGLSLIR
jgi:hypothetical protein